MSEVIYHTDEVSQQVIAEREGRAIGRLPWTVDGQRVTMGLICVAPPERRQGIGLTMITKVRERFPREDGWELVTTPAMTELGLRSVWAEGKDERRESLVDEAGTGQATPISTPQVIQQLNLAHMELDRILGQ